MSTPIRPSTIRRLTRAAKSLYPTLRRIPAPLPRPGSPANVISPKLSAEEARKKSEAFEQADKRRLDKGVIAFFANQFSQGDSRR